ncbi:unnamed protein product [Staurois parvus]|uniref:Uncharacterized protein n=1 Tax=Staurois parvus TaxID=386267 RepID=A0ABN9G0G3_9NEOB|nr:unnamed protein product [Staurois parvus]
MSCQSAPAPKPRSNSVSIPILNSYIFGVGRQFQSSF